MIDFEKEGRDLAKANAKRTGELSEIARYRCKIIVQDATEQIFADLDRVDITDEEKFICYQLIVEQISMSYIYGGKIRGIKLLEPRIVETVKELK